MFSQGLQEGKVCCPFNKNHIFAKQKFVFHLNRCKDRQKVKNLFTTCQYNSLHFIPKDQYQTHVLICPDKSEIKRMVSQLKTNYQQAIRNRERSRQKIKKQEDIQKINKFQNDEELEEEETTLSDCQECQKALSELGMSVNSNPKLMKYLNRYKEINRK